MADDPIGQRLLAAAIVTGLFRFTPLVPKDFLALGLKFASLGFELDRRQLDEVYRRFVVLADRIKDVEDHHLLQLIRESQDGELRIPAAHVQAPISFAAAAVSGSSGAHRHSVAPLPGLHPERKPSDLPLHPMAEHHHEEDYLWGV